MVGLVDLFRCGRDAVALLDVSNSVGAFCFGLLAVLVLELAGIGCFWLLGGGFFGGAFFGCSLLGDLVAAAAGGAVFE